mgnify:FL=1
MREMQSMHPAEKDQFCEYIYEDFIVKTALVLCQYEKYAKVVNLYIPISCYTNFRDSLFHFRKMVSSIEEREIEEQSFAIKEHLSRTLTDASTAILYWLSAVSEELLKRDDLTSEIKMQIRKNLHKLKNVILFKRMNGMMISQDVSSGISHEEILALLDEAYVFFQDNCSQEYAECSNELSADDEGN